MAKNPVVQVVKEQRDPLAIRESADGVKYQLHPVSPALMEAVTNKIEMPTVPMWHNKDMDRDEPNPNHPDYVMALERANNERGMAVYDALIMFGIQLVEGMPEDESWIKKLHMLEKIGRIDLSKYDLSDDDDREFVYKRFVLADSVVINELGRLSSLTAADVNAAGRSFPGNS